VTDKIKVVIPVLVAAALEIEGSLREIWWKCKRCKKEYEGTHSSCPGCGYLGATKILKPFKGKVGHWAFGVDGDDDVR
jgi:hypothetical protein